MITAEYARVMARYNRQRNEADFAAADTLDDAARRLDRGAFFGSIHGTLSHLLWGDLIWLHRFGAGEAPQGGIKGSATLHEDWAGLCALRRETDRRIIDWAAALDDTGGELRWYSDAMQREFRQPLALLIVHFFNHQTHHRGQAHAMLTAAGARPGTTDLPFMPD